MIQILPRKDGLLHSSGKGWEIVFDSPAKGLFTCSFGEKFNLISRYAILDSLEEAAALPAGRKVHHSDDGAEASFESVSEIPFGAEPSIARSFHLSEGLMSVTMDFEIRPSFEIRSLFAGGFSAEGGIAKFGLIRAPGTGVLYPAPEWTEFGTIGEDQILYDENCPPLSLLFETEDGYIAELSTGEDFWRWCAKQHHTRSRYTVKKTKTGLEISWIPFEFHPGGDAEVPPGRGRRMNYLIAWKKSGERKKKISSGAVFDMAAYEWPESCLAQGPEGDPVKGTPCFASSAVINILKKWVRKELSRVKEGDVLSIVNAVPVFCHAASHQDRAKQKILPHTALYAMNGFRLWANRQLRRVGAELRIFAGDRAELPSMRLGTTGK